MRAAVFIAVLLPGQAFALPWLVDDPQVAAALDADLDRLWSSHDIDVVSTASDTEDRLAFEGDVLALYAAGHRYERDWDGRTDTAVLLARSWLRELRVADGGWIPDLPEVPDAPIVLVQGPVTEQPEERTPLVTLPPPRIQAGLGMRLAPANGYGLDGPRLTAGVRSGPLGVEATLFAAAGSYLRESSLDRQLGKLDRLDSYSAFLDTFTLSLMGELALPTPTSGLQGGPLGLAGFEVRRSVLRRVTQDPDSGDLRFELDPNISQVDVGPAVGIGIDLWAGPQGRLRVAGLDRIRYRRRSPSSQRRWTHDYALTVDLLVIL